MNSAPAVAEIKKIKTHVRNEKSVNSWMAKGIDIFTINSVMTVKKLNESQDKYG